MMRSKIYKILLALALLVGVERFCRSQTEGFRLSKATSNYSYPFVEEISTCPAVLDQPFYFLGSGVQFYVFIGKDHQTVLKLFKHHHMGFSTDFLSQFLPPSHSLLKKREKRMLHLFESVKIASQKLPRQTGVIYTHLQKTDRLLGETVIHDKLHIAYPINLDKTEFVLQKLATPVYEHLDSLFREKRIEEAIASMHSLVDLIRTRSELGIKNKDGNILENCGFLDNQPIELDIGSFVLRSVSTHPNPHQKAALSATLQLLGWIKRHYPENLQECRTHLIDENIL
ncbi:MAG: hypothetical protein K1000chlam2_00485 [Chlamydiae bacterium]|nr:hypothetical protein [Chlamydiota bacterium]